MLDLWLFDLEGLCNRMTFTNKFKNQAGLFIHKTQSTHFSSFDSSGSYTVPELQPKNHLQSQKS
jgi:hypothetical protein